MFSTLSLRVVLVSGAVVALAACSGAADPSQPSSAAQTSNEGNKPGATPGATAKEAELSEPCGALFDAQVETDLRCQGYPVPPDARRAELRTRATTACARRYGADGAQVTAADVNRCANALKAVACDAYYDFECDVTKGTRANNASCDVNAQCQSGNCSYDSVDGASCGRCGAPFEKAARAGEGQSCAEALCASGLVCTGEDAESAKCVKAKDAGAACTLGECKTGLVCRDDKCQAPLADGAACTDSYTCELTSACSAGKCTKLSYVKTGETCDDAHLCEKGSCVDDKCVAPIADGAACTEESTASCDEYAYCISGTCQMEAFVCK